MRRKEDNCNLRRYLPWKTCISIFLKQVQFRNNWHKSLHRTNPGIRFLSRYKKPILIISQLVASLYFNDLACISFSCLIGMGSLTFLGGPLLCHTLPSLHSRSRGLRIILLLLILSNLIGNSLAIWFHLLLITFYSETTSYIIQLQNYTCRATLWCFRWTFWGPFFKTIFFLLLVAIDVILLPIQTLHT